MSQKSDPSSAKDLSVMQGESQSWIVSNSQFGDVRHKPGKPLQGYESLLAPPSPFSAGDSPLLGLTQAKSVSQQLLWAQEEEVEKDKIHPVGSPQVQ